MHQESATTATMTTYSALPGLPASPTLTNPDMILPYGEYDSTPSPPQDAMHLETLDGGWKGPIPDDLNFSIGPPGHLQLSTGPMTPITPIIYGNGTMLSDIGEVTEAESTPGRKSKTAYSRVNGRDSPVRSSPTMGYDTAKKRTKAGNHHRSVSMESGSTVLTEGQPAEMFKDFDDGISVDDSNFQGDDEESVLDDGYDNELEVAQAKVITRKESRIINTDDVSSAALSRRAEMILANAKKRLDNMEGNLTRARSSLFITPSSSMSSIHSSSPLSRSSPSPPDADRRIITGLGVPPARHRQTNSPLISPSSPGHSRILSETSVPSALKSSQQGPHSPGLAIESPGYPEQKAIDIAPTTYTTPSNRISNHLAAPLELLSEDEAEPIDAVDRVSVRASTAEPQSNILYDHRGLTRSTSSMQMRDLTDKMKDLKGKISTLRDRAREDNLKRRSLQSLRTPSPFTAAEQWYTTPKSYKGVELNGERRLSHSPWNGEPSVTGSVDGGDGKVGEEIPQNYGNADEFQEAEGDGYVETEPERAYFDHEAPRTSSELDENYDTALEGQEGGEEDGEEEEEDEPQGDVDEEIDEEQYDEEPVNHNGLEDYDSESGASLYHDSSTTPLSHEDRDDAFDYEHFFLHSAMGTISAQRLARRDSSASFSSEDSVETARGPEAPTPLSQEEVDGNPRSHVRGQKSTDSVSTLASFATATEGRRSSEIEDGRDTHDRAVEAVTEPFDADTGTAMIQKRSTFGKSRSTTLVSDRDRPTSPISRPASIVRASSAQAAKHHASISSFASTGTTRSFPLVNKPKNMNLNPRNSILSEALNLNGAGRPLSSVDMLAKEDQILIERLVASVGKGVLGLQEAGRASSEGRMWRRRLDAARRILESQDGAI